MRSEVEAKALKIIENLDEGQFDKLARMQRNSTWEYVGSNGRNSGDDAMWMRYNNGSFDIISSSHYGEDEKYTLIKETNMDLLALKNIASSVISFGDCTSNGSFDPETDEGLSQIIESIAFSLPGEGSYTDMIDNSLLDLDGKDVDAAMDIVFKEIADRYEIPFES